MSGRRRKAVATGAQIAAPETVAAAATLQDLHPQQTTVTTADVAQVAAAAVQAAPATQVRRPWRSTVRTAFQVFVGLAPMVPAIVHASGLNEAAPPVAGAIAISSGVTRIMALPGVESFLQRWVPWLAATPRPPTPAGA